MADGADEMDEDHNVSQGSGVSTNQILAALLVGSGMLVTGIVVITIAGGPNANAATTALLSVMSPILGALLTALVVKLSAMHKQFNQRMDEYLEIALREARAEGAASASEIGRARAAQVSRETAVITAERAEAERTESKRQTKDDDG